MSADQNALNAMREGSTQNASRDLCLVGAAAARLNPKELATFEEAMFGDAASEITGKAIMDYAKDKWGWTMHPSTLRSHRRGSCACDG